MKDWFPRGVFGKHPHRGIETVTYVVEGRIDHYDNQGYEGTILPGDGQWMTAGRGLIHNEISADGVTAHSLQLWVNLPAADRVTAPRYQDLAGDAVPVRRQSGVEMRVFSSASGGLTAPTKNIVPVTMVEIRVDQGASARQDLPSNYNSVIVVLEGEGAIGAEVKIVRAGDVAWLTRGDSRKACEAEIRATDKPLRALLNAGRPLHEAVVARGPFVMNTEAEIEQAYADYRVGRSVRSRVSENRRVSILRERLELAALV
jgi:quercetin 2,3-dioxygenase